MKALNFYRLAGMLVVAVLVVGSGVAQAAPSHQNLKNTIKSQHTTTKNKIDNKTQAIRDEMAAQHDMVQQDLTDLETRLNDKIDAKIQEVLNQLTTPCGSGILLNPPRFVVNGPEVCDNTTGTRWQRVLDTTLRNWQGSKDYCAGLDLGNGQTYRLAELAEYQTLLPLLAPDLNAPTGPFTNVQSSSYWSATTHAGFPANAWIVLFINGIVNTNGKGSDNFAWCLRSGS